MTGYGLVKGVFRAPRFLGLALIWVYQRTISPLLGPRCRYYPSCSHYGYTAVERYGLIRGSALAGWRILRCNPWSAGGIDDVPGTGEPLFRRKKETGGSRHGEVVATTTE
ncbi:MAG: membrane protein insertion efficiency factor YidD [Demequinaceae bacterium]|nr:membrane protein insertion efficiency factor YidD [Demequinaceae bacterium]